MPKKGARSYADKIASYSKEGKGQIMSESNAGTPAIEPNPKQAGEGGKPSEKLFTQAEVDKIVKERVARVKQTPPADYEELKQKLAEQNKAAGESESALEKLQNRLSAIEEENKAMKHAQEVNSWREEVAKEEGVPASILRGDTREEIEAHAQEVKSAFDAKSYPTVDPGKPAPPKMTKEQILAIEDKRERMAAMAQNIDLFN